MNRIFGLLFLLVCLSGALFALELEAPIAQDEPNDAGNAIEISWQLPDGIPPTTLVRLMRKSQSQTEMVWEGDIITNSFTDEKIENGVPASYHLLLVMEDGTELASPPSAEATARGNWFDTGKLPLLVAAILLSAAILYYIYHARQGKEMYIRRIAALDAIDEAVGRSTEMGKPILFVPGIMDMDNVQTIAGVIILGHIAKFAAQYDTPLNVPVSRSLVMSTAREVVKESYLSVGRPDAFHNNMVHYVTDDQFGFVAGVDGIMMRERPATNFYLGCFYAESLILAETGNSIGAIQIAGTAQPSQLPFFVAACDYTLIGEELFAASAYLARDPHLLGSLKGQDFGKLLIMLFIIVASLLQLMGVGFLAEAL